jgi:hypothetical protein
VKRGAEKAEDFPITSIDDYLIVQIGL